MRTLEDRETQCFGNNSLAVGSFRKMVGDWGAGKRVLRNSGSAKQLGYFEKLGFALPHSVQIFEEKQFAMYLNRRIKRRVQ